MNILAMQLGARRGAPRGAESLETCGGPVNLDEGVWRSLAARALDWWLPQPCLACGLPQGGGLCAGCAAELPWSRHACARCALPLTAADAGAQCGRCLRRPPPAHSARVLLHYADPVDRWLAGLKFSRRLACGRVLSRLMREHASILPDHGEIDAVVPMPLHPRRLRQRGFNQVVELLRPLGDRLPAPVRPTWLQRTRDTPQQTGLDAAHRRRNLRGAFHAEAVVQGKRLLLVDDVITTGSSVNEASRCLLRAGAQSVHVLGWARVTRPLE